MKTTRILVWDLPVRVFHWLLVVSFAGALLTAESERLRDIHAMLGYTFLGLLLFRLVWGFVGSRYARWRSFAFGPTAAWTYLRSLLTRNPVRHVGHNPAGSWYIYLIVALGIATGMSGLAVYGDLGGKWIEALHEGAANAMLALAVVHVAGVVATSFLHRENLVAAMLTGYKSGQPQDAIAGTRRVAGLALAACVFALWSGLVDVSRLLPAPAKASITHGNERPPPRHEDHGHHG